MVRKHLLWLLLMGCIQVWAQPTDTLAWRQGYAHSGDTTYFLFEPQQYGVVPQQRVIVTGSFRAWSQDMADPAWQLRPGPSYWYLAVFNPSYATVPIRAEFKFRIDDGLWMQPPRDTPNEKGGNLVFLQNMTAPTLKAELRRSGMIWASIQGAARPIDPAAYRLLDAAGQSVEIREILPNTEQDFLVIPARPIDIRRVYHLELPGQHLSAWCSYDGWFRDLYSDKELGANIAADGSETVFRIFSPRASLVKLYLYQDKTGDAHQQLDMVPDAQGVWEATLPGNLKGIWYDFTVHGPAEPGNHFYESVPVHISDPYARVNDECWGRSRVWTRTQPATPLRKGIPPLQDVVAYEVHVQDFTDLLPVADDLKGTLPAFYQPGLCNKSGRPVGFDYLVDLGINVLHLMPVQEYMHYPDEDWRAAFLNDPFMIEQGIATENYQWGYRTSHCFAVENRYRRRGTEHGAEREQFRDLVQAFHDKDIAVIIDIVPNHTAENMDDEPHFMHWNVLDKIYHYRTRDLDHIGEYGNEVKTENRPMVQRWLIDQCRHWIEEFGIDGFRIDLAGQIDRQTLIKLREALGPDIIIYGEPWIGSFDPDFESNPSWDWYKHNSPITYFQDESRNAYQGPPSNPYEKGRDQGYAGGNFREIEHVKRALINHFADDRTPLSGISYLDIHDNWAMADRFALHDWDGRRGVDEDRYKIAALLLYTTLGPLVTHGGTEMIRSKGVAPLQEVVKETPAGIKVHLHGKRDTYNMRRANQFVWENLGKSKKDPGVYCNYEEMYQFWRGLNHFRQSDYGKVFRRAERADSSYYQWIDTVNPYQLGYIVDNRVFVLINTGGLEHDWNHVWLPEGTWRLVATNAAVDHLKGVKDKVVPEKLIGGHHYDFRLPGTSLRVWVRD
ncbi:MAG: hypothetical protein OHK0039_12080 [Bacteroidia bacterium]